MKAEYLGGRAWPWVCVKQSGELDWMVEKIHFYFSTSRGPNMGKEWALHLLFFL